MVTKRDSRVGAREINYEFGINKHTLLYIKQIKTRTYCIAWGNYSQYLVIIYNGKESENIYMCIYICASVQFSSVTQLCLTLCDPMECSTPGLSVHHQLPEFAQTHVHWVGDAIQPSHPLSSPSPPTFNLSQHQGFFPMSQFFTSGGQGIVYHSIHRSKWQLLYTTIK